jgi:ABC-2 type transport system permease protein
MATADVTATHRHVRAGHRPRPHRAVALLTSRVIVRGALAIALGLGALIVLEGLSFETAYPDAASRRALLVWAEDPGVRIISGPGSAVDTVGGFAMWDAGLYLTLIAAAWALTATTRVLRGDEEAGRSDLVQVGAMRAPSVVAVQLAVLFAACILIGGTVGLGFAVIGAETAGSILAGLVVAGYAAALVAMAALASQVFATRRRALAVAGGILLIWILLRMAANSADRREWLGWFTPAAWLDRVEAFDADRWEVLLVPLGATVAIGGAAVLLRGIRDSGAGLVRTRTTARTRRWGLGGTAGFAWRTNLGVLVAWAAGLAAAGFMVGALLPVVDEFLEEDEGFVDLLTAFGMDPDDVVLGFVAMISTILGLVIAVYAAFRMGATRAEEASERAELLLTRPLPRWRWLGAHVLTLAAAVVVLAAVAAAAMWLGAIATDANVTAADAASAMANALPAIAVFAGLAVLVFGLAPRLTVPLAAGAAAAAYVIELVGPLLEWPEWVLGVSPFHHLEQVPIDPVDVPAALVMTGIGVVLAVGGILALERRDLVGA